MTRATCIAAMAMAMACGDDDTTGASDAAVDSSVDAAGECSPLPEPPRDESCEPLSTDYRPCLDDEWPACISDLGEYSPIEATISTVARVRAFEEIAGLLFTDSAPAEDDFLMARRIYQEDEGLDSRVVRRFDPRFDVPDGTDCSADGVPTRFPDYCVGPAILQPILLDAFMNGIEGSEPRIQAARIEGALLWFLYASTNKESFTCTTKAKDCDSSYAYYTGGESARGGLGLARYVRQVDEYAHDRAWDGALALRCWRDLDPEETAVDLERRELARTQYDRAVTDGVAAVVRDELVNLPSEAEARAARWAFIRTLGPALDHPMRQTSATDADAFAAEIEKSADAADIDAATAAIDNVFACP